MLVRDRCRRGADNPRSVLDVRRAAISIAISGCYRRTQRGGVVQSTLDSTHNCHRSIKLHTLQPITRASQPTVDNELELYQTVGPANAKEGSDIWVLLLCIDEIGFALRVVSFDDAWRWPLEE
jgi:hypothetical protein